MADARATDQVFINCPFDVSYTETFRALIFTIFACQFRPRSTKELDDGGQARIEQIYQIINECRYGIHDISRTDLDPEHSLPRFNMPLELGIFMGARKFGSKEQKLKRILVLDIEKYRYQKFISDLAGSDIQAHGGVPVQAVKEVRDWLANVSRRKLPVTNKIAALYERFAAELPGIVLENELDLDKMPYVDFENIVVDWLLTAPAI